MIAAAILIGCIIFLDVDKMMDSLRRLNSIDIVLILCLYSIDRVLMAVKWRLLLRVTGVRLSLWSIIRIYYQGSFAGTFLPTHLGGDLLRAYWVSDASGITHPVFASLVMERLIGVLSAANWAVIGAAIYGLMIHPQFWWLWLGLSAMALIIGNGLFMLSLHQGFHTTTLGWLGRLGGHRIGQILQKFYKAYADFSEHRLVLLQNACLTVIEHAVQMATVVFIAQALEIDALHLAFLAATAVFMFAMRLPIAPDGWGVGELAAIALFVPIGVQAEQAFAMTLVGHVLVTLALLPGLAFMLLGPPVQQR